MGLLIMINCIQEFPTDVWTVVFHSEACPLRDQPVLLSAEFHHPKLTAVEALLLVLDL